MKIEDNNELVEKRLESYELEQSIDSKESLSNEITSASSRDDRKNVVETRMRSSNQTSMSKKSSYKEMFEL